MSERKATHEPRPEDEASREPFRLRALPGLVKATAREFGEDKVPKQAAALAYYTLFAIGPLLVLAIGIAALAFGAESARDAVLGQFGTLVGSAGGKAMSDLVTGADRERVGIVGTLVGVVVLLFSAGAVFAQLKEALNRIWEVQAKKAEGFWPKVWRAVRKNFLSFAGVMGTGFLLLVSLVVSAGLAALGERFAVAFPGAELLGQVLNFAVSLAVVSLVFAMMFKFLPDVRIGWRDVIVGATFTAILFLLGQFALGYYLGAGPFATRYGTAGAVLVILVWVYYSSLILFFGAELTQVYANQFGSHVRRSRDAVPISEAVSEEQAPPEREGLAEKRRKGRPQP